MAGASVGRGLVAAGTALAAAGTAHSLWNLHRLRVPPRDPPPVAEPVAVLLPVRDEARRVEPCLRSLLAQTGLRDLTIVVLDDGSTDGTADVVRRVAGGQVRLVTGAPLPPGWWGKPWACDQLARTVPDARVLVFVDADVVLAPQAVAASVALLRWTGLDLVSPYPRQVAVTPAERLVQPLLQWSWLTTLPLRLAERSARESLAAANGQLLVVDATAYRRAGGHAAVRDQMLEDVGLLRAVKRSGGRGIVVDGTHLATCRMYDGWRPLRDGYAKSLWSAFGSPAGAAGVTAGLALAYLVPPVAALRGSRLGAAGWAVAVIGRAAIGRRVGSRVWPDALAHPVSVATVGWLTLRS
ncbi:MAG: glycosyltransferase, partial [Actinomycetes bacterium]